MESQMVRPHGHTYEQDPHLEMEGEDVHHNEKTSVLKKVKAKAKKIKDTIITKHGHGHNHDRDDQGNNGDHIPDDHDLYEEDDEDEEMTDNPEVHGAPIYESTTDTTGATPANTPVPSFSDHGFSDINPRKTSHDPIKTSVPVTESKKVNLEIPTGLEKNPDAPKDSPDSHDPSNYQTKVTDPTGKGAEEIGITPILHSLGKMNIGDDTTEPKSQIEDTTILESSSPSSTGSHNQFSPENTTRPTSYTEKISSATSAIAEKAVSAKNAVVSKLGYGSNDSAASVGDNNSRGGEKPASAKIAETLAPVYEKVAGAGTAAMSKIRGGGGAESGEGQERGVSVKGYLAEKLRPGEDDEALSEAISGALRRREEVVPVEERVGESEEVKRRLGEDSEAESGPIHNSYVGKVKDTVGSWLGYGSAGLDHSKPSQGEEGDNVLGKVEERRLQESSNN